jgi:hypothetical protein
LQVVVLQHKLCIYIIYYAAGGYAKMALKPIYHIVCSLLCIFAVFGRAIEHEVTANSDLGRAAPSATVTFGNSRFTVLTPRLIRMENTDTKVYSFDDRNTLVGG